MSESVASLGISHEFWCVFCGVLGVEQIFLKTGGLLVLFESCSFFGLVFRRFLFCRMLFSNFMALLLIQLTAKRNLDVFLLILCLFFRIFLPAFVFNVPACFLFLLNFPKRIVGLFFSCITYFGLVFQIYLHVFAK